MEGNENKGRMGPRKTVNKLAHLSPAKRMLVEERLGRGRSVIENLKIIRNGIAQGYERVARDQPLPVSFGQEIQLQYIQWAASHSVRIKSAELPAIFHIKGPLDISALEKALEEIMRRHEVFRTSFHNAAEGFAQVINPAPSLSLRVTCLPAHPEAEQRLAILKFAGEEIGRPLDLTKGRLLRVKLLRLGVDDHVLLLITHKLICDDWSQNLLISELMTLYGAFASGASSPLPAPVLQFADFTHWQRQWLKGEILDNLIAYWKQQLQGISVMPEIDLPFSPPETDASTHRAATQSITISPQLSQSLKDLSFQRRVTLFMLVLAAFKVLLHGYTGRNDIALVSPVANRHWPETERVIGHFANSLILRTDLSGDPRFTEILQRVRKMTLGAYAHQDLPLPLLLEAVNGDYESRRCYVFFNMLLDQGKAPPQVPGLSIRIMDVNHLDKVAKPGIRLHVKEGRDGIRIILVYEVERLRAADVVQMLQDFHSILESIVVDPNQQLSALSAVTKH